MNPTFLDLQDASAWKTLPIRRLPFHWGVNPTRGADLILIHANGRIINVFEDRNSWAIKDRPDGEGRYHQAPVVARFEKTGDSNSLQGFQHDLDRAYGDAARQQLTAVVNKVVLHCMHNNLAKALYLERTRVLDHTLDYQNPLPIGFKVCEDPDLGMNFTQELPASFTDDITSCAHVISPQFDGSRLDLTSKITLEVPVSGHARLAFLASMTPDVLQAA